MKNNNFSLSKKSISVILTAAFLVGGFFVANSVLALHQSTATVEPTLVAGGSTNTYLFTITKMGIGDDIIKIKIERADGFEINQNPATVECPAGWSVTIQPEYVECVLAPGGDPINDSGAVSFEAIAPQPDDDRQYQWVITTTDLQDATYLPTPPVTTVDDTVPSVTISSSVSSPTNQTPIPVTVTFSEDVTGFEEGDIDLSNGTVSNFIGADAVYSFDLAPTGQGLVTVDIPEGAAQDRVLHGNTAADQFSIVFDNIPPTVDSGPNQVVNATVLQDATVSDDAGSGIASYLWEQVSGPGTITFGSPATEDTTISADIDGTYTIRLTVTDNAGNSNSDEMQLTWDTIPPVITIAPYNTDWTNQDITVYASTNEGTLNADSHTFIENGSFDFVATDDAGNVTIETVTITNIDKVAPTVNAGEDQIKNAEFTVTGTADDLDSGIANVLWTQVSGPGIVTFGSAQNLETTISADIDGVYVISLTATDNAGNSVADEMQLIWDTVVPTISSYTLNGNAANVSFDPTDPASVEIFITASEAVKFTRLYICENSVPDCNDGTAVKWFSTNTYSPTVTKTWDGKTGGDDPQFVPDGVYKLTANIKDAAGNENFGIEFTPFAMTVDTVAPTVSIVTQVARYTNDIMPTLTINVENGVNWQIKNGDTVLANGTGTGAEQEATLSELTEGNYTGVELIATDAALNTATALLEDFTIDTTLPTITEATLLTPSLADVKIKGGADYEITWQSADITDANLGETPIKIEYSLLGDFSDAVLIAENETNDGTYSWTVPTVDSQTAKTRITVTDLAGNAANDESDNAFAIDSTAPVITLIGDAVMNLTAGGTFTDPGATALDNIDGDITDNIVVDNPVDVNTADTYIITYTVTDSAGNISQAIRTVNVFAPIPHVIASGGGGGGGGGFVPPPTPPPVTPVVPAVLGVATFNFASDLGFDMEGDDVTELQKRLTAEGVYSGPITGYFGQLTLAGVRAYQAKYGIRQTGFVGPLTRANLNRSQVAGASTSAATEALRTQIASLQAQLIALLQQVAQMLQAQAAGIR